jgi:hypothetical protein
MIMKYDINIVYIKDSYLLIKKNVLIIIIVSIIIILKFKKSLEWKINMK